MIALHASEASPHVERVAPSWGIPLTESDYNSLEESWISNELADQAMLRRVGTAEGRDIVGKKGSIDCAGILIPSYWPGETYPHTYRVRRDNPDWKLGKDGNAKAEKKYLGAPGARNRLYIPPGVIPEHLANASIPLMFVEGEKKALALQRLAYHDAAKPRFIPIAITGVWNWRGVIGKTGGPKGERIDVKGPIPDLDRIVWTDRTVFIVFDANVATNESVKWARNGIARELATRRANVEFISLPEDCGVNGVDDLLAKWGPLRVLELFEKSARGVSLQIVLPPQFQSRPEGMFRTTMRDGQVRQTPLTSYQASIKANICLDDGVEARREFELQCDLNGRQFQFTIPATTFGKMDWPIEQLGSGAITFPNQKDYARTAIQMLSPTAEERSIYTHSGWRKIDGQWCFLHAGGAVGSNGIVPGVNVRLFGSLSRYELRLPSSPESVVIAARHTLGLLELCPPSIGFPVLAAVFRATFGEADFSLHLAGETGAFKSELAALAQQFFGPAMNRTNLPGSWSSTGNSVEVLAFHAKDVLVVIDDFAPQGSAADVAKLHATADRIFRAAGNRSSRGRLDSTARLRDSKPPRGLILSTGEEIPRGHSIRARLLILELSKGEINGSALAECQLAAASGEYVQVMSGFLQWMANSYDGRRDVFARRVTELRMTALRDPAHARTPDIIANLQAAFEAYLDFCEVCGAVDSDRRETLARESWRALRNAAAAQTKYQAASEPAARFVSLVQSCLVSGQAHLASHAGVVPDDSPASCGWRCDSRGEWHPLGSCIGWVRGANVYLEPSSAYQVVQVAGRDTGEVLAPSETTLRRRLREKGLLASTDEKRGTLTVRRVLSGSAKQVLHMLRSTLLPDGSDQPENGDPQ